MTDTLTRVGFVPCLPDDAPHALRPVWIDEQTVICGYAPAMFNHDQAAACLRLILGRPFSDIGLGGR